MDLAYILISFTTLITIVNPVGAIAPYLSVTAGMPRISQVRLAKKAISLAGAALIACAAVGAIVFKFYGITFPAVKVAGGILVLLVSIDMLHAKQSRTKHTPEEDQEAQEREEAGIFPLAIPLITGPGAILSAFMLMDNADTFSKQVAVYVAIILVMLTAYLVLIQAHHISRLLGKTGVAVMSRLMGLVLASIAMQFIIDGLKAAFPGWAK
jgi:multiple antibiotic resistance protein